MDSVTYVDTQANFGVYGINLSTDLTGIATEGGLETHDTHIEIEGSSDDRSNA